MSQSIILETSRHGELVRTVTTEGHQLSGFLASAEAARQAPTLICFHGLGGNFDLSFMFPFLQSKALQGVNLLTAATSGQGNIAMLGVQEGQSYALGGSAFERFSSAVPDIAAWVDFVRLNVGEGPIILLGHSLGASKVAHYLANKADARVKAAILASPADLKGAFFALHGETQAAQYIAEACAMVARGDGRQLMPESCVIGLLKQRTSAETLLDRFADDAAADSFDFFERDSATAFKDVQAIRQSLLVLFGRSGEIVGPRGVEHAAGLMREHATQCASLTVNLIDGNHWYAGAEHRVAEHISDWLSHIQS